LAITAISSAFSSVTSRNITKNIGSWWE
jgi:hypothetical protein